MIAEVGDAVEVLSEKEHDEKKRNWQVRPVIPQDTTKKQRKLLNIEFM